LEASEKYRRNQETQKAKSCPTLANVSTRAYQDEAYLKRCVNTVVNSYKTLLEGGRKYPTMIEMEIKIEVVIPYG